MFSHYVRLCLTRKYADFHSRASRVEYLSFIGMSFMLHSLIMYLELAAQFFVGPNLSSQIFLSGCVGCFTCSSSFPLLPSMPDVFMIQEKQLAT